MNLELKHVCGYLPYGLHIKHNEGARLIVCGAFKKYNADDFFTYSLLNWDKDVKSTDAKPILRPLSDLDKSELMKSWRNEHDINIRYDVRVLLDVKTAHTIDVIGYPLYFINQLLEHHYDIYSLIPLGLAIDINTLK